MVERNGVHISKMTGKLDGLRAISTNTATNEYFLKPFDFIIIIKIIIIIDNIKAVIIL